MQYDPFRSSRDLGLTWPEVKLWPWRFKVIVYMVRRASTRQTRWYQNRCSTFKNKDFIVENPFWKILEFWPLETSILTWAKKWPKWFFASFRTLPLVFLYGDQEPRSWGGGRSNAPPPAGGGKSRGPAERGLRLIECFFPLVDALRSFRVSRGGGGHICAPPAVRRWLRPPPCAG